MKSITIIKGIFTLPEKISHSRIISWDVCRFIDTSSLIIDPSIISDLIRAKKVVLNFIIWVGYKAF